MYRIITFSSIQMFFPALYCVYGDYKTQNRKPNNKLKTSPQSYKSQIKILLSVRCHKVTLLAASYSACVVYTKTIIHLSVGE